MQLTDEQVRSLPAAVDVPTAAAILGRRVHLSRRALRWALEGLVVQDLTVARVAEGKRVLIEDSTRFDGVRVTGVDEHAWRHTRRGDRYVNVIIDLTPIRNGTGPARLLDLVAGRSEQAFKTWLSERPQAWRDGIEAVAMDRFTGFETATAEELPDAVAAMDPFHIVRLAGDAVDRCRRRIQQELHGHRGRSGDPLYSARRTVHTGADLLTDKQTDRLTALFAADEHVQLKAPWGISRTSNGAAPTTGRPRPSMAGSNTHVGPHSGSAT